jgi:hypothetical protein
MIGLYLEKARNSPLFLVVKNTDGGSKITNYSRRSLMMERFLN